MQGYEINIWKTGELFRLHALPNGHQGPNQFLLSDPNATSLYFTVMYDAAFPRLNITPRNIVLFGTLFRIFLVQMESKRSK